MLGVSCAERRTASFVLFRMCAAFPPGARKCKMRRRKGRHRQYQALTCCLSRMGHFGLKCFLLIELRLSIHPSSSSRQHQESALRHPPLPPSFVLNLHLLVHQPPQSHANQCSRDASDPSLPALQAEHTGTLRDRLLLSQKLRMAGIIAVDTEANKC